MLWLFKKKVVVDSPMEILGILLTDAKNTGREKYLTVKNTRNQEIFRVPGSTGFNPTLDRSLVADIVIAESYGEILDIGACNGQMSMILQERGETVYANDVSKSCIRYLHDIGIKNRIPGCVFSINKMKFDTILCLGSTLGIAKSKEGLRSLIKHLASILRPDGQIFIEDVDFPLENGVLEWEAQFSYRNYQSSTFNWCNFSSEIVVAELESLGFVAEVLYKDDRYYNYLVKAKFKD